MGATDERLAQHRRFWRGEGPGLILIPSARHEAYDLADYPARFKNPELMWEAEMARARGVVDWPTDAIPTVRPNLGVVFIPSMAGQSYRLSGDQMPWPGEPLGRDAIRAARYIDLAQSELMKLADEFYAIHRERGDESVVAYHPDTQGVFDVAHLLYGDRIFYDLADGDEAGWIEELLDICLGLYVDASAHVKALLGEDASSMIHGHGTAQGVYFPHAGVRMAEDTATLLSPVMIERVIAPAIRRAAEPFGGAFVHYCGKHDALFEQLCAMDCVKAIDLGNPEMYDSRWLMERCAETGTTLHSHVSAAPGETWEEYTRRVAGLVKETGARCILRPTVFPDAHDECAAMRDLWHELTA